MNWNVGERRLRVAGLVGANGWGWADVAGTLSHVRERCETCRKTDDGAYGKVNSHMSVW